MADPKEMIEWVKTNYDQHFKVANLLLAGHGAGVVGCLSVLKDWKPGEEKGIGIFVVLFGLGLLAAILNYTFLEFGRQAAIVAARRAREPDPEAKRRLMRLYTTAMTISTLLMCIAVIAFIFRFWRA